MGLLDAPGLSKAAADARYVRYLGPSNGTDDSATITAALAAASAAGGGTVIGTPGQSYVLAVPFTWPSNTTLDMTGCTINGPALDNSWRNAAAIPRFTVTDAVTTAGSAVVTSASGAFTSANGFVAGRNAGVLGAGANAATSTAPGTMYGKIVSVDSATQVTMSVNATLSTTGATLNVYPARDANITLRGGTWVGGNKDTINQTLPSHNGFFRRLDGLTIDGRPVFSSPGAASLGGRYALSCGDVTNVTVSRLHFGSTGGDGLHFTGPADSIQIGIVTGTTGDDMVAFTGVDGQTVPGSLLGDVEGDITNVHVGTLIPNNAWTALKITAGIGSGGVQRVARVNVDKVLGTTRNSPVGVVDYAGTTNYEGDLGSINAVPTNGGQAQVVLGHSIGSYVRARCKWPAEATPGSNTSQVLVTSPASTSALGTLDLDLTLQTTNSGIGRGVWVNSAAKIDTIILRSRITAAHATHTPLQIAVANTTVNKIIVPEHSSIGTGGNLIEFAAAATNYSSCNITIANAHRAGGALVTASVDSTNTLTVDLTNCFGNGALTLFRSPFTVRLSNCQVNTNAGAVRLNSTAATGRIEFNNMVITGGGTLFSRTATQAFSVNGVGTGCGLDVSALTPKDGDVALNTNAALGCGTGPAIYNLTAAKWKGLYSGLTN